MLATMSRPPVAAAAAASDEADEAVARYSSALMKDALEFYAAKAAAEEHAVVGADSNALQAPTGMGVAPSGVAAAEDTKPRFSSEACAIAGELVRIFVTEAILRAKQVKSAVIAQEAAAAHDGPNAEATVDAAALPAAATAVSISADDIRTILPQLVLDFA